MVPTKASCPSPLSRHDSLSLEFKGCPWRNSHQRFQCRRAVSRGCSLGSMVNVTPRALVLLFVLCRTPFYFIFIFSRALSFPFSIIDQRETTDSPDSTLARLNSRISSTLLAMTRASRRSPNHAVAGPIACYPTWDASAIVRLPPASLIGPRSRWS